MRKTILGILAQLLCASLVLSIFSTPSLPSISVSALCEDLYSGLHMQFCP